MFDVHFDKLPQVVALNYISYYNLQCKGDSELYGIGL